MLTGEMTRHTTFRFCLDPTVERHDVLARHAGASRFAFNECLGMVKTALTERKTSPDVPVPWTGFDLINAFNAWKKTEDAGRVFAVDADGVTEIVVTGLAWRTEVCQQVFEEAVVDRGKGLKSWSDSRSGKRTGKRVGFPRFKKKTGAVPLFRLRNKHPKGRPPAIRVGDNHRPRSVTLPGIGPIAIHDDTRRLRRMLANNRAKILFATITHHGGHWWVSLNIEAADLHPGRQHRLRSDDDTGGGWIGVDRGLSAFGSVNRHDAARKLGRHHHHVANVRRYFLHQVSNELVKTHDRLVIEDLNVSGMLANHSLARAISDAGWAEFARLLRYKQAWRGGQLVVADRWYPSSRLCPLCGSVRSDMTLADRVFACGCGHSADRDTNAAVNLARWGHAHHDASRSPDPQAGGRATNARRQDGADQYPSCAGETSLDDAGTDVHTAPAA
jgi:putative transposase